MPRSEFAEPALGMARAYRPTGNDHINRYARMGARRSDVITIGIRASYQRGFSTTAI